MTEQSTMAGGAVLDDGARVSPVRRVAVLALVLLAILPLLLYVYQGQFIRLIRDDYGHLGMALEAGTWEALLFWREHWNGDYSNYLLYSLLAPLREKAPMVFPAVLLALGLAGFYWLNAKLLAFLAVDKHRRSAALALASLILVAFINGAYDIVSFYWFTGSVEHTLPVLLLLPCLALGAEAARWARSPVRLALAAAGFAGLGFLLAGFSEIYLIFQAVFLALLALYVCAFAAKRQRRALLVLTVAGFLGSLVSLMAQATAPGAAYRMLQSELWGMSIEPVRELFALVARTGETMLPYLVHAQALAGIKLLAAVGLAVTLILSRPARPGKLQLRWRLMRAPLVIGFLVQLAFLPFLWAHTSNSLDILGRYSYQYFTVIMLNLALIAAMLAMLVMLARANRFFTYLTSERGFLVYCSAVLLIIGLLFVVPELRSIHHKAAVYFCATAYLLIGIFIWQLAFACAPRGDRRAHRMALLTILSAGMTVVALAALLAGMLWVQGVVFDYTLPSAAFMSMVSAVILGAAIGALLRRSLLDAGRDRRWIRWASLLSLGVAGLIGWGIVADQLGMIDELAVGAEIWDDTHQEILLLRDSDAAALDTQEFLFRGPHISRRFRPMFVTRRLTWRERLFYGLDYEVDFPG